MYKYIFITETDRTCCFHCGIVLANWLEADSVWHEHAKYLKTIKHFMCYIVLCVWSWCKIL